LKSAAREIDVKKVAEVSAREALDVALLGLELHFEHALELISCGSQTAV
jgi:hypothetical protein